MDIQYLDSVQLIHQLSHRKGQEAKRSADSQTRTIPIFIFTLDSEMPVFMDQEETATALHGMVVAVESNHPRWETQLACNARPIHKNLRSALKSTLAATAKALGGLLPLHSSYIDARTLPMVENMDAARGMYTSGVLPDRSKTVTENWLWSVGDSTLCETSSRAGFTWAERDSVHRNYLAAGLHESARIVNYAVYKLATQTTSIENSGAAFTVGEKNERSSAYCISSIHHTRAADG